MQRRTNIICLGAALLVGVLASGTPRHAGALSCDPGELLAMTNPVVTVIAGPGDAAAEQERWSKVGMGWLHGMLEITVGEETFSYEAAP